MTRILKKLSLLALVLGVMACTDDEKSGSDGSESAEMQAGLPGGGVSAGVQPDAQGPGGGGGAVMPSPIIDDGGSSTTTSDQDEVADKDDDSARQGDKQSDTSGGSGGDPGEVSRARVTASLMVPETRFFDVLSINHERDAVGASLFVATITSTHANAAALVAQLKTLVTVNNYGGPIDAATCQNLLGASGHSPNYTDQGAGAWISNQIPGPELHYNAGKMQLLAVFGTANGLCVVQPFELIEP